MIQMTEYGPWAVVTGATSGIGRAFADQLAAAGIHLVLASRSTERLTALGRELTARYDIDHRVVTVDLSQPGATSTVIEAVADLDVALLVSNAGGGRPGRFLDQDLESLHRRHTLNAVAHMELTHAFGRRLVARGRGGIIVVSALAMHGLPNMANDSASKAYALYLGEALHHELGSTGVDVTVMLPGNVETPIIDSLGVDRSELPVRPQSAAAAVRETLEAFAARRPTHIPGRMMRLIARFIPRSVSMSKNGQMLGMAADRLAQRELDRASVAPSVGRAT